MVLLMISVYGYASGLDSSNPQRTSVRQRLCFVEMCSVKLNSTWRLVVLDTMDISKHPECTLPVEAADFLAQHPADEFPQMGLGRGYANGGMGKVQVEWLKATLNGASPCGILQLLGNRELDWE